MARSTPMAARIPGKPRIRIRLRPPPRRHFHLVDEDVAGLRALAQPGVVRFTDWAMI